ncbi:MAG: hypothetical protein IPH34_03495 [Chitinophagaceae bacterium]|nr:hypothetical protein [Chitinophagaceae bacterium]MBK8310878.1 hypothetical protein [Chitinophagaceae bacterium]MBK8608263.1 hypothetical protein [Chitinophagaceae bacterium]MBP6477128.1 hypothetical protein [Chitinophagaceae bacterium]MBP7108782.1 hypothetical protein [Chitinophagaceae bacterium]
MKNKESGTKDLYFTKDHEWIDFQGSVAYVGISYFKLIGFKEIQELIFIDPTGFKNKGESIAAIKYNDYQIEVTMPVDGKLIKVNTDLLNGDRNLLLNHAESISWVALIAPSQPFDRNDLILAKQYQMNGKSKYAK